MARPDVGRAARPRLRVVPQPRPTPRRAPFVVVVLGILVLGLAALLVLNTVLAEGAFQVHDLERDVALLADEEQALQQQVAELAAPSRLAQQARMLGMVPLTAPAFLRTSDGAVLGRAAPATGAVPSWAVPPPQPKPPAARPEPTAGGADQKTDQPTDQKTDQPTDQKADQPTEQDQQ